MKKLRTILIDDEIEGCELLEAMLAGMRSHNIELLGKAHTVADGIALIEQHAPDLVLLDVKMSPGSGFDILNHFETIDFEVIFTTAHEEYAVRAIRFAAIDYLLKPIDPLEFEQAIARTTDKRLTAPETDRMEVFKEIIDNSPASYSRIVLPTMDGFIIEKTSDICYCKADRNYTHFQFSDGRRLTVPKTLKVFETMMRDQGFFRSHVSFLVNLNYVKEFKRRKKGGSILLKEGTEIPLSESRKKEFVNLFV